MVSKTHSGDRQTDKFPHSATVTPVTREGDTHLPSTLAMSVNFRKSKKQIYHLEANILPHTSCLDYGNLKPPTLKILTNLHIIYDITQMHAKHYCNNVMQCVMLLLYYVNTYIQIIWSNYTSQFCSLSYTFSSFKFQCCEMLLHSETCKSEEALPEKGFWVKNIGIFFSYFRYKVIFMMLPMGLAA